MTGKTTKAEKPKGPAWGYKKTEDGFESKLFPDGKLPKGWKDTPAGMKD